ncbi:PAS domain-containing protein [Roseovarius sp. C7]|uniref:PAS domain-containing protein n=1 Tax=Roseovarius sp. C7 TaxID=3398643 RepID=UPI0039F70D14
MSDSAQMAQDFYFLPRTGELAQLIRSHDWETSALGPIEQWPQPLRAALSICMHSDFPTAIYWGPELRLLYNDAWAPIPAERHPGALGRPAQDVWSDIWEVVGPQLVQVMETGEGFSTYDQMLPMVRDEVTYETYWNYSFTPIWDEDGRVVGVFNQGNETTEVVMARRRAAAEIARLGRMFEQAPAAIAMTHGPDHEFELTNSGYLTLVGKRDLIGRTVVDAFPEVIEQGFVDLLDGVYTTGEPYIGKAVPVTLNRETGIEERMVDFVYQPVFEENGTVSGIFMLATDVTDAVHAERALRFSEERYQAIVNSIDQMIWSTRPDGYHDFYNERWYEYTGVPQGSTDGTAWNGMFHPDDRARARAIWQQSLDTGKPYEIEYRLRHRSGEYRWVIGRAQCLRDETGQITRWYGTCTDIHDQKLAEQALAEQAAALTREIEQRQKNEIALQESEEFNRSIVDSSGDCIKVLDLDGHVRFLNSTARVQLEIDDETSVVGRHWLSHWPKESHALVRGALDQARSGSGARFSSFRPTDKGTPKWWDVVVTPVLGTDGAPERVVCLARDITAQIRAEEARDLLLREMDHRVKNLFSVAAGMVSMTARSAETPAEMADKLKGRFSALAKAHDLIRSALTDDHHHAEASLETLLSEILRPHLDHARPEQIEISGPEIFLPVEAGTSLALVFHECATNTVKYGALASLEGTLDISWRYEGEELVLCWKERIEGGTITEPSSQGFGSRLVSTTTTGQLNGAIDYDWQPTGVIITLRLPLETLA